MELILTASNFHFLCFTHSVSIPGWIFPLQHLGTCRSLNFLQTLFGICRSQIFYPYPLINPWERSLDIASWIITEYLQNMKSALIHFFPSSFRHQSFRNPLLQSQLPFHCRQRIFHILCIFIAVCERSTMYFKNVVLTCIHTIGCMPNIFVMAISFYNIGRHLWCLVYGS